jgi:AP-4 complex subunit mu-1
MISNFFVLSPRGDTILAKQYRVDKKGEMGAHERSHTEALFRKIKFWDDMALSDHEEVEKEQQLLLDNKKENSKRTGDAPPVMMMPDGLTYFHVKRNGLIFGASSARNVSPNTVVEVSTLWNVYVCVVCEMR